MSHQCTVQVEACFLAKHCIIAGIQYSIEPFQHTPSVPCVQGQAKRLLLIKVMKGTRYSKNMRIQKTRTVHLKHIKPLMAQQERKNERPRLAFIKQLRVGIFSLVFLQPKMLNSTYILVFGLLLAIKLMHFIKFAEGESMSLNKYILDPMLHIFTHICKGPKWPNIAAVAPFICCQSNKTASVYFHG